LAANTISYSAGIINNYYFHRTWTFALGPQRAVRKQFLLFVAVSLMALAINSMVVFVLGPFLALHLPDPALAAILAKVCATAAGISWNFFANHRWTFGR
ncbi:MAG TPA: GtrA family protein, partial [Clostridia bacterium]|nr:GtrA family protein [Clostridia bacterium]